MDTRYFYNEEYGYEIEIWVETTKSLEEFELCLSNIIDPLIIENHTFNLGGIACDIQAVTSETAIPTFEGVPQVEYSIYVTVHKKGYDIWDAIDHHFAFAIAQALRTKFSCSYLITADGEFFIYQGGANLPTYINTCYKPLVSGELVCYRTPNNRKTIELSIPSENPYR